MKLLNEICWNLVYWILVYAALWVISGQWIAGVDILSWQFGLWLFLGALAQFIAKKRGKAEFQ